MSIAVIHLTTRATLWSVTARADPPGALVGDGDPDDQRSVVSGAAVADVATVAAALVAASDPGPGVIDIMLVCPTRFHLVRELGVGTTQDQLLAHLTLDRRMTNLAAAQREFASLLTAHAAWMPTYVADDPAAAYDAPDTHEADHDQGITALPRRQRTNPANNDAASDNQLAWPFHSTHPNPPAPTWTDTATIDRVLDGLRAL